MNQRPKLLFLAYNFPPVQAAASVRTWNIAKYLSRLNWDVTVVTPDPIFFPMSDNSTATEEDLQQAGINRILTGHKWRVLQTNYRKGAVRSIGARLCRGVARYLDIEQSVGWIKAVDVACRKLTGEGAADVILATGPPYGAFRCAGRLAQKLRRPYVLDYRDAWTGSPFATGQARRATVDQEDRLLKHSAAVTVVSPTSAAELDRRFKVGSKLHVVSNGFDSEDLAAVEPYDFGHFAIVYTGIFYPPKRVITPLMAACQMLKRRAPDTLPWKFHYYGSHHAHVRREAERFEVVDRVEMHGVVSRAEALSAVKGAGVSVIVQSTADSGTPEELGVVPGKVFEAVGLSTPILLVAPASSDIREIVKASCKAKCYTGSDITGITHYLLDLMQRKQTSVDDSNDQYSWPVLANKLDAVLKRVIEQRND